MNYNIHIYSVYVEFAHKNMLNMIKRFVTVCLRVLLQCFTAVQKTIFFVVAYPKLDQD